MMLSSPNWSIPVGLNWLEINGYPMAFRDEGAGAPLVLIHGSFCDYRLRWVLGFDRYEQAALSRRTRAAKTLDRLEVGQP